MSITQFYGEYRFLSNFWPAPVNMNGVLYPSVEHAYQAAKCANQKECAKFLACTTAEAKRMGRSVKMRPDWNSFKLTVMKTLLERKFAKGSDLANQLLTTGVQELVEGNTWGDRYWGVCKGIGENHLGKLLMQIRKNLYEEHNECEL